MGRCGTYGCLGHLGKFSDCLTEALWTATMDGTAQTTGDVEYQGHLSMIIFPEVEDIKIETNGLPITVPTGTYLVHEDSVGFVSLLTVPDGMTAGAVFNEYDVAYGQWLGDD